MNEYEDDEEIGFNEDEALDPDDVVTLRGADGQLREHVLLAVVDYDGTDYAVLVPRDQLETDDSELMLARYDENAEGAERFSPVEDDSVILGLQDVIGHLVGVVPQVVAEA